MGRLGIDSPVLLGSTSIVLSNDAPGLVKWAARMAKFFFNARVQICDGTDDHLEIQAALDALPAGGGKVVLLDGTFHLNAQVDLDSYQSIEGQGESTSVTTDADWTHAFVATGASGTEKVGISISNIEFFGQAGIWINRAIEFTYVQRSDIINVTFASGTDGIYGSIYCDDCDYITIDRVKVLEGCQGVPIRGDMNSSVVTRCQIFGDSTEEGIQINGNDNKIKDNIVQGAQQGIDATGNRNIISGNTVFLCHTEGIYVGADSYRCIIKSNICHSNGQAFDDSYANIRGYRGYECEYVNNICREGDEANQPQYGLYIDGSDLYGSNNVVSDNDLSDSGKTSNFFDRGALTHVEDNNVGIEITQIKHFRRVKNTSGGALAEGDVVILKAVAAGDEITTTAVQGDDSVFGMVAEAIADTEYGLVQVKGFTDALSVSNDHGNIAIGDILGTNDTVKEACKAAAGDQAFARALEACAAANCTIDAYIKSPWD